MRSRSKQNLVESIRSARSVVLSTHRECDGDGLGAELAFYHALKKTGKSVRVLNVDRTPEKYRFLGTDEVIERFDAPHEPLGPTDLALVFDTNDRRLLEPLYPTLEAQCREVVFIDHHPVLKMGPAPTSGSVIDVAAASTGEIAYGLLRELGVELDARIARALYVSIAFDTHLFRFVRGSPNSHVIAADLLRFEDAPEEVHRRLFADYTVERMSFLARALGQIEYSRGGRIAIIRVRAQDMLDFGLDSEASRDVIDLVMNIERLEAAALFREEAREEAPERHRLSLRSKGRWNLLPIAEKLGGGGHPFAAGASLVGSFESQKRIVVGLLEALDA